jgi:Tellurite resistance protein TerB
MSQPKKTVNPAQLSSSDVDDTEEIILDLEEAFLVILLLANAADGEVVPEERQALAVTLERMHIFSSLSTEEMEDLFARTSDIFNEYSIETIFEAVKNTLPLDLRETAFAAATDLVFADRMVTEEEEAFLGNLWGALDISDETGRKILEVMEILHRG